ncbi:Extended synaptotagmin-2 [Armadillidium nasatum]|uniref:Extended synaptotagmin-2 n=1 Tax=Armadillidium nasatum TaxID=96803 RepID=A0A5N5T5D3_9CRUS|nr:Extended synaptotagmin-2 [Armadillidium nasatum]
MPSVEEVEVEEVAKDIQKAYGVWFKSYAKIFARRALEWLIVYLFGYYNASFGWLMAPLFFLVLRDKRAKEKRVKFDIVRSLANTDEREVLNEIQRFSNLPSWVTFPDMERVEWLNKIIRQLWPYAGKYVRDLCNFTIEPSMREALKEYKLTGFKFEKIILGDTPPRFSGMKVYDDTSRHEIILDADFIYAGDCKFEVAVSKFKAGIKDLQISGRIRVVMKPLVRQIPLVGGLQVFFLNNPDVDFNLIGIADVFDMPGLSDILRSIVVEQIANMMVLPNRYPIQLVQDINVVELKCPAPAGVIRLQVIEAQNLMKKDIGVLGMGKSDPYCILKLGAQKFQTKTINNTVNPKWDFVCEYLSDETSGQSLTFEVVDLDDGPAKDELLGRANLDVQSIYTAGEVDMWVPLSEAKSGRLHIHATWLDLSETAASLEQQLAEIRSLQTTTKNPLHSAVLMVWVDSAKNLNSIPDPYVRLHVGNTKYDTAVHLRTNDPIFEEGFTFLVMDQKTNQRQGKLQIDLNSLLKQKTMETIGEEFSLSGAAGGRATIKLNLTLRILKTGTKKDGKKIGEKEFEDLSPQGNDEKEKTSSLKTSGSVDASPTAKPADAISQPLVEEVKAGDDTGIGSQIDSEELDKSSFPTDVSESEMTTSTVPLTQSSPLLSVDDSTKLRHRDVNASGAYNLGRIQLTVTYGPRNNLVIVVHRIANLPLEEDGEIPDPYVKLYLLPDRSRDSKRKTDVMKDNASPVFDERFEYSVAPNELTQRTLQVSVINKKGFFHMQRSPVLGQIHIDCGFLDPSEVTNWYDLAPPIDEDED